MTIPEPGRSAAHVLIDVLSSGADGGYDVEDASAQNLALARISEIGAVTATYDDETDAMNIDASDLIGGALTSMQWLVTQLAVVSDVEETDVLVRLRSFLDGEG